MRRVDIKPVADTPPTPQWATSAPQGHAFAWAALQSYCQHHRVAPLPAHAWEWQACERPLARCARLRQGGLRVASPSPCNVPGILLLAHELGHAALEHHQPGSLGHTAQTERFAMGCELWTAKQLLHSASGFNVLCDAFEPTDRTALHQAVAQWLVERQEEFATAHAALSAFEWAVYQMAQQTNHARLCNSQPLAQHIEHLWQQAHHTTGVQAEPWAWATHPLLLRKPGTAHLYLQVWQAAQQAHLPQQPTQEWAYAA